MSEHHAQAVQMSQLVMQRSEDEDVRRLAVDIDNNQNFERGQMAAWLTEWGLQRSRPGERMEWMEGHDHAAMELPPGVPRPYLLWEELFGATAGQGYTLVDLSNNESDDALIAPAFALGLVLFGVVVSVAAQIGDRSILLTGDIEATPRASLPDRPSPRTC